jgi:hypothetical protein
MADTFLSIYATIFIDTPTIFRIFGALKLLILNWQQKPFNSLFFVIDVRRANNKNVDICYSYLAILKLWSL